MVKWKKISKKLLIAVTVATMLLGTQMTAFAYVDPSAEASQMETETTKENVLEEEHTEDDKSFSVPGNAEVLDDIDGDSSKEFLTVTTKNNNTFYIVIDRSSTTDNVYMLSQIDENDLKEFLTEEETEQAETETPGIVLDDVHTEDETPEAVIDVIEASEKNDMGTNVGLLSILLLAGAGIGAYYYFKIYKGKQEEDDSENEGLEQDGAVEEETINEDEEAAKKAASARDN